MFSQRGVFLFLFFFALQGFGFYVGALCSLVSVPQCLINHWLINEWMNDWINLLYLFIRPYKNNCLERNISLILAYYNTAQVHKNENRQRNTTAYSMASTCYLFLFIIISTLMEVCSQGFVFLSPRLGFCFEFWFPYYVMTKLDLNPTPLLSPWEFLETSRKTH